MENQGIEEGRGVMKKAWGAIFFGTFTLCGCGIDSLFGTIQQQAGWIALFAIMLIAAAMAER